MLHSQRAGVTGHRQGSRPLISQNTALPTSASGRLREVWATLPRAEGKPGEDLPAGSHKPGWAEPGPGPAGQGGRHTRGINLPTAVTSVTSLNEPANSQETRPRVHVQRPQQQEDTAASTCDGSLSTQQSAEAAPRFARLDALPGRTRYPVGRTMGWDALPGGTRYGVGRAMG